MNTKKSQMMAINLKQLMKKMINDGRGIIILIGSFAEIFAMILCIFIKKYSFIFFFKKK